MSNEPELSNLPIGHPLVTRTIYQSLAEITAHLLGTTTFVETALNQADLFANQGKPEAIALALEVWPESHWPGFALRQADVFQSYAV